MFENAMDRIVLGCDLRCTCEACPEQYDVYLDEQQIGYLRLRHGFFRADYQGSGGETVYSAEPEGDGVFEQYERERFLAEAVQALLDKHHSQSGVEE